MKSEHSSFGEETTLKVLQVAARGFLVAFFLVRVAAPVADLDMWHEMALIRESLAAGHLLLADVYAYTPTIYPMVDHEWGAGALLYLSVKVGGAWAVVGLKFLVALLTGWVVLRCAMLRKAGFAEMTVLAPLVIPAFGLGCATLRAQAYSFLFFAALLWLLELDSAGNRRWIAAWMAMLVLWVNMHGGCVIGIMTLGLYWIERVVERRPHIHILAVIAASVAAMSVNPYGVAYYRHLWGTLRMARPEITEWYGIQVLGPGQQVLFWLTVAIAAMAIWKRGWRASGGALIVAAMAGGTILHARMIPFYAVAWAAYVPAYVSTTPMGAFIRGLFRHRLAATAAATMLTMFFVVMFFEARVYELVVPTDRFPVGAVRYLKELRFHGNVMTYFEHGAYVSWWMYPAVKVSMDSRYDVAFPPAAVDESFAFFEAGAGWRQTLEKYPTDLVLAPNSAPVAKLLGGAGWNLVYRDRSFGVYARPGLQLPVRDDSQRDFPSSFP